VRLTRVQGSAARSDRLPEGTLAAYAFDCAGGPSFVLEPVGAEMADVMLPQGPRRLTRERTASGVKYSDKDGYVWSKGRAATLELGERNYQCVENRARSIREDARARGVEFRGAGNEPGWVLEILADRIIFTGNYGSERTVTPRPAATNDPASGATLYTAVTEAHKLQARIEKRECRDSMSGEPFEARVEVQLDGRIYRGCGYPP
jgi:putative lipoprotein